MSFRAPSRAAIDLDLSGQWLVPPFADAHSHSFGDGRPSVERQRASAYVRDGVFYVMSQANQPLSPSERADLGINTPKGPDVSFANGLLTAHNSPVQGFYRAIVLPTGAHPGQTPESLVGSQYFEIDDADELDAKWPAIRAQRSDFIKVYLHNTERDAQVPLAPFFRGFGMTPAVLRSVVNKAHKEGLRVSAHVATAGDVTAALDAHVDLLAHVTDGPITPEIAIRVARSRVPVMTTVAFRMRQVPPPAKAILESNLRLLAMHGAQLIVGADFPPDTSVSEVAYLRGTGLWSDKALLKMWSMTTPKVIFPKRRISVFEEGAEASFLALDGDPLSDWEATKRIRVRVKAGQVMSAA